MSQTASAPVRRIKRHPIRSGIAGILGGVGLALLLILYGKITLGTLTPFVVIGVFFVASVLWGLYGPKRKPKKGHKVRLTSAGGAPGMPGGPGGPAPAAAAEPVAPDAGVDPSAAGEAEPPG